MNFNEEKLEKMIFEAVSDSLEKMAFVEVQSTDSVIKDISDFLSVSLIVTEPAPGEFSLFMPVPLVRKITSTIFSLPDDKIYNKLLSDTVAEILNTIAGYFLSKTLYSNIKYRLEIPIVGKGEANISDPHRFIRSFEIEGEYFLLSASLENLLSKFDFSK